MARGGDVMKLTTALLGNKGAALATAKGRRFQLIWRLYPGSRRGEIERKRTTFTTKAQAKAFKEKLRNADLGFDGRLSDDVGQPKKESPNAVTVFDALATYVESRWATEWSENQRAKVRGRLLEVLALTPGSEHDQRALLAGLEQQRLDRGSGPDAYNERAVGRWVAALPRPLPQTPRRRDWSRRRLVGAGSTPVRCRYAPST